MTDAAFRAALRAAAKVALALPLAGCGKDEAPPLAAPLACGLAPSWVDAAPRETEAHDAKDDAAGDAADAATDADPAAAAAFGCCAKVLEGALPDASFATYFDETRGRDPSVAACCRFAIDHLEGEHEPDPSTNGADRGELAKRGAHFACCAMLGFPEGAACSSWGPPAPPSHVERGATAHARRRLCPGDEAALAAWALGTDPALHAAARATWRARMVQEHRSGRVFVALAAQLAAAGVDAGDVATCAGYAAEEHRHGVLCATVLGALGGAPVLPAEALPDVPVHPDAGGAVEVALRNVLAISCVAETVAVALLAAERHDVDGPLRSIVGEILADEVGHARFGWRTAAALAGRLDGAGRARTQAYVGLVLAEAATHFAGRVPASSFPASGAALGLCDGCRARALIDAVLAEVVVPRLGELGLVA